MIERESTKGKTIFPPDFLVLDVSELSFDPGDLFM